MSAIIFVYLKSLIRELQTYFPPKHVGRFYLYLYIKLECNDSTSFIVILHILVCFLVFRQFPITEITYPQITVQRRYVFWLTIWEVLVQEEEHRGREHVVDREAGKVSEWRTGNKTEPGEAHPSDVCPLTSSTTLSFHILSRPLSCGSTRGLTNLLGLYHHGPGAWTLLY